MKFSGRLNDMLGSGQRTLGTQVFDDLFSKITTRQWREGEKLPSETDLARHYNVSRPVIRAAIQELRAQGFVTTTKGLGTFVKRCNYDQVSSIRLSQINDLEDMVRCYEYRIALEGKMAYWAAMQPTGLNFSGRLMQQKQRTRRARGWRSIPILFFI